jgi:hypothetical protein
MSFAYTIADYMNAKNDEKSRFVEFVCQQLRWKKKEKLLDLLKLFSEYEHCTGRTKRETLEDLWPFLHKKAKKNKSVIRLNIQALSERLPMLVCYRHLSSVVYVEKIMQ